MSRKAGSIGVMIKSFPSIKPVKTRGEKEINQVHVPSSTSSDINHDLLFDGDTTCTSRITLFPETSYGRNSDGSPKQ